MDKMTRRVRPTRLHRQVASTMECLPRELSSEIMARVAANSLIDIANVKLSCKVLKEIAEDPYVYQNASLSMFPVNFWHPPSEEKITFLNKCLECKNPEILYRKGVVDYFDCNKLELALDRLRNAASLGHIGALYAIGIIALFNDGEFRRRGMAILSEMKKSKMLRKKFKYCHKKLIEILRRLWVRNSSVRNHRTTLCRQVAHKHRPQAKTGWPSSDTEEDNNECDACICDTELVSIRETIPRY